MEKEKSKFYNGDIKEQFLAKYENENSRTSYARVLKNSKALEELLGKDLSLFTLEEFNKFFKSQGWTSKNSARTTGRVVTEYIDFVKTNNLRDVKENILEETKQAYFEDFVEKQTDLYLHKDDIEILSDFELQNKQDGVILQLLFEGVQGSGLSELVNLNINDVNKPDRGWLTLHEEKQAKNKETGNKETVYRTREIQVSNLLLKLIRRAHDEKTYVKKNGEMDYNPQIKDTIELSESTDYILKTGNSNRVHEDKISKYTIYNRIEMIRELDAVSDDIRGKLTTKNIVKSGMINKAKEIYLRDGKLEKTQLLEVCKQFGVKYNWQMRDHLNVNAIEEVYPEVKELMETK